MSSIWYKYAIFGNYAGFTGIFIYFYHKPHEKHENSLVHTVRVVSG
jgi:hypothetical protein